MKLLGGVSRVFEDIEEGDSALLTGKPLQLRIETSVS